MRTRTSQGAPTAESTAGAFGRGPSIGRRGRCRRSRQTERLRQGVLPTPLHRRGRSRSRAGCPRKLAKRPRWHGRTDGTAGVERCSYAAADRPPKWCDRGLYLTIESRSVFVPDSPSTRRKYVPLLRLEPSSVSVSGRFGDTVPSCSWATCRPRRS